MKKHTMIQGLALLAAFTWSAAAQAEVKEITVAQQYGISYLPMMLMDEQKLIEKHAKALGLGDVKVSWSRFKGGTEMNDAILSNNLHFASGGVGPLITLWAKTKGSYDVKAVAAMNSMPLYLNTRNPNVKTLKDFTEKDKIASFISEPPLKRDQVTVTSPRPEALACFSISFCSSISIIGK